VPELLNQYNRRQKRKFKANALGRLDMNDHDVASLHIPYEPGARNPSAASTTSSILVRVQVFRGRDEKI
jgi:hypothetical protein